MRNHEPSNTVVLADSQTYYLDGLGQHLGDFSGFPGREFLFPFFFNVLSNKYSISLCSERLETEDAII